tara:strand:+ start:779 stop:1231 length:453 start_codon:yes stop_codon:yes gene_type:complete
MKIALIISKFNYSDIVKNLEAGVQACVNENNISLDNVKKYYVPGSFEIPFMCNKIIKNKDIDAIITLGCIIKGETAHFEFISSSTINTIAILNSTSEIPIMLGIITAYNRQQAIERSSLNFGDKNSVNIGYNACKAMLELLRDIDITPEK